MLRMYLLSVWFNLADEALEEDIYDSYAQWEKIIERSMSKVRSKVEHVFRIEKGLFGFRKVRYRGIKKNLAKLNMRESERECGELPVGGLPMLEKRVTERGGVSPVLGRGQEGAYIRAGSGIIG
jgi:hypothetical protein